MFLIALVIAPLGYAWRGGLAVGVVCVLAVGDRAAGEGVGVLFFGWAGTPGRVALACCAGGCVGASMRWVRLLFFVCFVCGPVFFVGVGFAGGAFVLVFVFVAGFECGG